jgi:choice-of-anchor B domain-containing protein
MRVRYLVSCFTLVLALAVTAQAQESGAVRYLGHIIPPQGGSYTAGCWGWTDTTTGREYALLGNFSGTSIVEITNPNALVERDFVPGVSSSWRELQVYQHYAYVVSEGGGGTQIIDLAYLPDSVHLVKNFVFTQGGNSTTYSHTLHIKDGYMYLNGCAAWSPGGIVIFDLADPVNPVFKSVYTRNYVHDCFVRHDTIFAAAIYGIGADIISVTNKSNPQYLYTVTYPGSGTHNTATTADGRYLFTTDEIGSTAKTLKVWDLSSPPSFPKVAEYVGSPTAIVHNAFVKDSMVIMSYYTAGMRVINIADPTSPVEVGGYDSYPSDDNAAYTGAWSVYPFFPSGRIIIGDMASGMYVVDINLHGPMAPSPFSGYSDYQTPTSVTLQWNDPSTLVSGDPLSNFKLHVFRNNALIAVVDSGIETYTDPGLVKHQQYTYTIRAVAGSESSSVASAQVYAGGAAQASAPSAFEAREAIGGTELRWHNPSTQIDGTPLNDLAGVQIYRDGAPFGLIPQTSADTGQARTYLDPVFTYHTYSVRVLDNEAPVYYSAFTPTIGSLGGAYTTYRETFDSTLSAIQKTGGWDTTDAIAASGPRSLTDSPFGSYDPNSTSTVILPSVICGAHDMLQFRHIAIVAFADFAFVEISKNHRTTYAVLKVYNQTLHAQWQDGVADPGDWVTESFDLSAYAGDTVNVRFRLVTNGTVNADGWYLDDLYVGPATEVVTADYAVNANWNMVSLPLRVSDSSAAAVFPGAVSPAYRYAAGYAVADTLSMGGGYWLKFPAPASVPLTGAQVRRDTVDLLAGWNMIGSISASIDTASLRTIPAGLLASPLYGYAGSYAVAPAVEPGKAYWVKTSAPGKLVLSAFVNKSTAPATAPLTDGMGRLRFTDAAGREQTLFLSEDAAEEVLSRSELPPVPPADAFDVRFATGRYAASLRGAESIPVRLQAVAYPLAIEWELPGAETVALRIDGASRPLHAGGRTMIAGAPVRLELVPSDAPEAPREYALAQNFPNPFNPATEIRFDLPAPGLVTLRIFDLLGREVRTLVAEQREPGRYSARWDAAGSPSGIYYARLNVSGPGGEQRFQSTRKLVLAK